MAKFCLIFVTVKVKFHVVQAMKFQKGSKVIALLFLNLHNRRPMPHPGHITQGKRDPIPVVQFFAVAMKSQEKAPIQPYDLCFLL
jgi:hypothetical protein